MLYPFIEGSDGYHIDLSEQHWFEFGKALNNLHNIEIPPSIKNQIQKEMYSPQGRKKVKNALQLVKTNSFSEPTAASLALFLMIKRYEIYDLVEHAENLAARLQTEPPPFTVCHSDAHAGNILIDKNDHLYIVDWDNPILAPKERDLMFPGGAQGFRGHTLIEEEILFYRGYGQTEVNQTALAYYRYERVIQDLAVYCEQLLMSDEGGEDRERSLQYLKANFLQGNTLETAYRSDRAG
jgi:spectinomycin phosphotransferase